MIHVNEPDLVLFVGEALVGNEAVDQLVKFNQALADNSAVDEKARLIDGIVLTKFDTIDDKVDFLNFKRRIFKLYHILNIESILSHNFNILLNSF